MSEKRFKVDYEVGVLDTKTNEIVCDTVNAKEVVDLLNEQQTIISQLKEENEQLRQQLQEKQEDEKEYAREILRLNKLVKEYSEIRQLGGDY